MLAEPLRVSGSSLPLGMLDTGVVSFFGSTGLGATGGGLGGGGVKDLAVPRPGVYSTYRRPPGLV